MVLLNKTIYLLTVLFLINSALAFVCEPEWVDYEDNCYRKLHLESNYTEAVLQCRSNSAEILTIDSADEQDFVTTYLVDRQGNVWLDADNSKYQDWYNGSVPLSMQCAVVIKIERYESKWFKVDCAHKNEVVCKRPSGVHPTPNPTPEPTPKPTTNPTAEPTSPPSCKAAWTAFQNKCCKVTDSKGNHAKGKSDCEGQEAEIASIHSKAENDFIATLYDPDKHGMFNVWLRIGAVRDSENSFRWLDGTSFDYTNWADGFPIDIYGADYVWYSLNNDSMYKEWVNDPDYDDRFSVCSYEAAPSPTTISPPTTQPSPNPTGTTLSPPTPTPTTSSPSVCRADWKRFQNKCYKVTDSIGNHAKGKGECEGEQAEIASIHSAAENNFIASLYDSEKHGTFNVWFRIGAIRDSSDNSFSRLDGTTFDYTNWVEGYPVDIYGDDFVWYSLNQDSMYKQWVNDPDYDDRFSVCSYETGPAPTTISPPTTEQNPTPTGTTLLPPTLLPSTTASPSLCRANWKQFGKKCYRVTDTYKTHEDNLKVCEGLGATLTSVHSETENNFIVSLFDESKHKQGDLFIFFHLGAKVDTMPNFSWEDGTPFDYTHWKSGYPVSNQEYTSVQVGVDPRQYNGSYTYWENFQKGIDSEPAYGVLKMKNFGHSVCLYPKYKIKTFSKSEIYEV